MKTTRIGPKPFIAVDHAGAGDLLVFLHGIGKVLPKGAWLPVPFFVDAFVGAPIFWQGDKAGTMVALEGAMMALAAEGHFPAWE